MKTLKADGYGQKAPQDYAPTTKGSPDKVLKPGVVKSQKASPTPASGVGSNIPVTTGSSGAVGASAGPWNLTPVPPPQPLGHVYLGLPPNGLLKIESAALGMLVDLQMDGTITYGPNYAPDATARTFWEAIFKVNPLTLEQEILALEAKVQQLEAALLQTAVNGLASSLYGGATLPVGNATPMPTGAAPPPAAGTSTGWMTKDPSQDKAVGGKKMDPYDAYDRAMKGL